MRRAHTPRPPRRQRGAATLFVALVALLLLTLVTLYSTRHSLFEQRTAANQFRYSKAFEAAQGGVDYAIAWLGVNANVNGNGGVYLRCASESGATWVADSVPPFNEKYTLVPVQLLDGYTATITLRRNCATGNPRQARLVEIASVVSTDDSEGAATVRQIVDVNALRTNPSPAPLTVNGCLRNVTGTPDIYPNAGNPAILTSSNPGDASCMQTGHFNLHGGTVTNYSAPSAWDLNFPYMSKNDLLALAKAQPGGPTAGPIYYYQNAASTVGTTWNPPAATLGSATQNVIVFFDFLDSEVSSWTAPPPSCPKISGNVTIWGIVYCEIGGDMNGWGNMVIHGALMADTGISAFNANTTINYNANAGLPINYAVDPVVSKVTGSWRDW